jgi:ribonuclease I
MGQVPHSSLRQSFTIHGIWPDHNATARRFGAFNATIITNDRALHDDMTNFWPPNLRVGDTATTLWRHEWDSHGHDYSNINLRLHENGKYRGLTGVPLNQRLQLDYFKDVLAFYKRLTGLRRYPNGQNILLNQIASILRIRENQMTISCSRNANIREIKVCVSITATGTGTNTATVINVVDCWAGIARLVGCTPNPPAGYTLLDWTRTTQNRVFNAPPRAAPGHFLRGHL